MGRWGPKRTYSEQARRNISEGKRRRAERLGLPPVAPYKVPCCSEEEFHDLYVTQQLTETEIGEKLGVNRGSVHSTRLQYGIPGRPRVKRNQQSRSVHIWKNPTTNYHTLHYRVYAVRGQPNFCSICQTTDPTKNYDWANLTGKYDDVWDYARMCRSCHWKKDGLINNITKMRKDKPPLAERQNELKARMLS